MKRRLQIPLKELLSKCKRSSSSSGPSGGGGGPSAAAARMRDDGLPVTDAELVARCQREYEEAAQHGGQEALDACFRLAWALVHSPEGAHIRRGIELAEALSSSEGLQQRDVIYLVAGEGARTR